MRCVLQARRVRGIYGGVLSSTPLTLYLLGLSPLTPLLFLAFVAGCGFLRGVCLFFLWLFMVGVRAGLVNSVGLCGRLLGWGECVWAVESIPC